MLMICGWLGCLSASGGPSGAGEGPEKMHGCMYEVPADLWSRLMKEMEWRKAIAEGKSLPQGPGVPIMTSKLHLRRVFEEGFQVRFPEGSDVKFHPHWGKLIVFNHMESLDQIGEVIHSLGKLEKLVVDQEVFHPLDRMALDGAPFPEGLAKWQWRWSAEAMEHWLQWLEHQGEEPDPFAQESDLPPLPIRERPLVEQFKLSGICFPEGATVHYDSKSETLSSVNDEDNTLRLEIVLLSVALEVDHEAALARSRENKRARFIEVKEPQESGKDD